MSQKRRTKEQHIKLVYQVAELFYIDELKKVDIAKKVNVSSTHVTRLLEKAEELGIVKVEVKFVGYLSELEEKLKSRFNLQEVKVVEYSEDYNKIKKKLGIAAAHLLERRIKQETRTRVGIGGGQTLFSLVDSLESRSRAIDIYPMSLFGRGPNVEYVDSVFLSMLLFMKSQPNAQGFIVGIPPLPSETSSACDFANQILCEIPEVKKVINGASMTELAFVGAGAFMSARDIFKEYQKIGMTYQKMKDEGVVGGINYNYFDEAGYQIGSGILTTQIETLRSMSSDPWKTVVLVAGGEHKFTSIRVAIETKMVNSLITDENIAKQLLKIPK